MGASVIVGILAVLMGSFALATIDAGSIMLNIIGVGLILGIAAAVLFSRCNAIHYDISLDHRVTCGFMFLGALFTVCGVLFFFHSIG